MSQIAKEENLKKSVRNVIVSRNTVKRMGVNHQKRNCFSMKYLNEMSVEVINVANRTHKHLAYYLITGKI